MDQFDLFIADRITAHSKTAEIEFTGAVTKMVEASPGDPTEGFIITLSVPEHQFSVNLPSNHWEFKTA